MLLILQELRCIGAIITWVTQYKVIIIFCHLQDGKTALHVAAMNGHEEVVDVLLRAGARAVVDQQMKVRKACRPISLAT